MSIDLDDFTPSEVTDNECPRCQHEFDPHALVATGDNPTDGGVMLCHVKGCMCYATWDVPPFSSRESVREPDSEELAWMRTRVQIEDTQ